MMNMNLTINADCINASTSGYSDTANAFCTDLPFTSSVGIAQSSQHKELCSDGSANFWLTKKTSCFLLTTFRLLLQGFRELAASRTLSELRTAEEVTAAAKAEVKSMDHENEREIGTVQNLLRQPEIHLFAARFKDHCGDIAGARESYQLLEAIIRYANIEYRLVSPDDACSLYESTIAIEKGKEQSQISPILFAQYSRFLYMVLGRVKEAKKVLNESLENNQLSKPLLEALIHIESIQSLPKQVDHLDSLVDKFISPGPDNLSAACFIERELSSIFLVFQDLFRDAQSIKKSNVRHLKLFLHQKSSSESKKCHQKSYSASDRMKVVKNGTQNHWPAGISVQPQATLNSSYGTYNAYGSSYAQPQVPTSIPQAATYAS